MPILLEEDLRRPLPRMYRVRQQFDETRLEDVAGTVRAELAKPEIRALAGEGKLVLLLRRYAADDLEGRDIVFAASDDTGLNDSILSACRERGILVNVSSDRRKCDFFFPAIAQEGAVVAGICSGGDDITGVKRAAEAVRKALKKS